MKLKLFSKVKNFRGAFRYLLMILIVAFVSISSVGASTISLTTTKSSASVGEIIPVNIKFDTNGSDVVVMRAIIRYNPKKVSVNATDIDLTGSVFNSGNTCVNNGAPCQIITNDATNGILSIILAMPSHSAPTAPGATINGSGLQFALVNFHAIASISETLTQKAIALQYIAPIGAVPNYTDSDVILDDQLGTDSTTGVSQISSAMYGDLNLDGIVDISDFSILKANFDSSVCGNVADIIGIDCTVDISDFSQLKANFDRVF